MSERYLYSPWRIDYILGEKPEDCVLCRFKQEGEDKDNLIVWRGKLAYVMLNRYPYNNGHLMIVPYEHGSCLNDLDEATLMELAKLSQAAEQVFKEQFHCEGVNLGLNLGRAAGAGIEEHLHVHMVPRWLGDDNFMSVIGARRVIPEAFEQSWERLRIAFDRLMRDKG